MLNKSLIGNDIPTIWQMMSCVDSRYFDIIVLQEQAKDLLQDIKKDKNFFVNNFSDEKIQLNDLKFFSKRSFRSARKKVLSAGKRIKQIQRKNKMKREPRPKSGLFFCPKSVLFFK